MTNRPEWMLGYFRAKVEDVMRENPHPEEVVEELARLLTHYALLAPDVAKQEVHAEED